MEDPGAKITADALRRRSTRIIRAVPLMVAGVDALGRYFEEQTSTSIVNCHGCCYPSVYYVRRNEWVILEVEGPESRHAGGRMRGRVIWVQRPESDCELFHFGVELEVPGNFWGIACCPPDWLPFPDGAETAALAAEFGALLH
jgi:hypothetical protein